MSPDTTADPVYDIAIWDTEAEDAGAAGDVVNWLEEAGGQVECRIMGWDMGQCGCKSYRCR